MGPFNYKFPDPFFEEAGLPKQHLGFRAKGLVWFSEARSQGLLTKPLLWGGQTVNSTQQALGTPIIDKIWGYTKIMLRFPSQPNDFCTSLASKPLNPKRLLPTLGFVHQAQA